MPVHEYAADIVAYNPDGTVLLLAEAKSRRGVLESWAAKLRRNMLAHGVLPRTRYFLIATPEHIHGWNEENLPVDEVPPHFTIDARTVLAPYLAELNLDPETIDPVAFEYVIHAWLMDIARRPHPSAERDPALESLTESGLLTALRRARIELNLPG